MVIKRSRKKEHLPILITLYCFRVGEQTATRYGYETDRMVRSASA